MPARPHPLPSASGAALRRLGGVDEAMRKSPSRHFDSSCGDAERLRGPGAVVLNGAPAEAHLRGDLGEGVSEREQPDYLALAWAQHRRGDRQRPPQPARRRQRAQRPIWNVSPRNKAACRARPHLHQDRRTALAPASAAGQPSRCRALMISVSISPTVNSIRRPRSRRADSGHVSRPWDHPDRPRKQTGSCRDFASRCGLLRGPHRSRGDRV